MLEGSKMKSTILKISLIAAISISSANAVAMSSSLQNAITITQTTIKSYQQAIDSYTKTMSSLQASITTYQNLANKTTNNTLKASYLNVVTTCSKSLQTYTTQLALAQTNLQTAQAKLATLLSSAVSQPVTNQPTNKTTTTDSQPVTNQPTNNTSSSSTSSNTPETDITYTPTLITNKPTVPLTTGVEYKNSKVYQYTGVETAWSQGYTGAGVTIADLDTGISFYNSDVSSIFNTKNIIEFANVYNQSTKTFTKTQVTTGAVAEIGLGINNYTFVGTPIITISGNGTGATATAIMDGNKISSLVLTSVGSGYSGAIKVTIVDSATGATVTTTVAKAYVAGMDVQGHGTATASLMVGKFDNSGVVGIAPDATLISVKVSDINNAISANNLIDGARAAALKGATIINQSMGTYATLPSSIVSGYADLSKSGITFVTAAGNDGRDCKTLSSCNQLAAVPLLAGGTSIQTSPGAWIVAGSLNTTGDDIASFSNRAGLLKNYFILAPGVGVGVANYTSNTTPTQSGTSYSAPIVSGAMALLQQKWPRLSGSQQAQILFQTANDMGVVGVDDIYGWGKMDLARAFAPVGDLVVSSGKVKNVAGLSSAIKLSAYSTSVSGAAIVTAKLQSFGAINSTVAFDSFQRDFTLNMTNSVSVSKQTFTFDQFLTLPISRDGKWIVGVNKLYDAPMLGYKNGNMSYSYSLVKGYFGSAGSGALAYDGQTQYINANYSNIDRGGSGIEFGMTYGYASAKNSDNSMIQMSDAQSLGAKMALMYNGFGLIGNIPGKIISGKSNAVVATGSDSDGNIQFTNAMMDLSKGAYEKQAGIVFRDSGVSVQLDKTFDQYNIAGLTSTNLRVTGQWNW